MELTNLGDIFIWFIWKIKAHAEEGGEEALNKVIHGKARASKSNRWLSFINENNKIVIK